MYIPEFWCGVGAVVVLELVLIIGISLYQYWKDKR